VIEPANPGAIYLPEYNPWCVYGVWSSSEYPPSTFESWTGSCTAPDYALDFGTAIYPALGFWAWGVLTGVITLFISITSASNISTPRTSRLAESGSTTPGIATACPIAILQQRHDLAIQRTRRAPRVAWIRAAAVNHVAGNVTGAVGP